MSFISGSLVSLLVEEANPFTVCIGPDDAIALCSKRTGELLGMAPQELQQMKLTDLITPSDVEMVHATLERVRQQGTVESVRFTASTWNGSRVHLLGRAFGDVANPRRVWLTASDVTQLVSHAQALEKEATHDGLTGLPNRALATEAGKVRVAQARRNSQPLTLLLIDVDRFNLINEEMGIAAGDALLKEISVRLQSVFRASDSLSRLGDDEFCVLLPGCGTLTELEIVCARVKAAIGSSFSIADQPCHVSVSLGAALLGPLVADWEQLLAGAEAALASAKSKGRSRLGVHDPKVTTRKDPVVIQDAQMHEGFSRGDFYLVYQPIVGRDGDVQGFESLMRWTTPDGRQIPPSTFIPLAESNGLIGVLGSWALRASLMQLRRFNTGRERPLYASVNVSLEQLRHPQFLKTVEAALSMSSTAPENLSIEITESMLMEDPASTLAVLAQLRALGVGISLDDFGTGYSSLSYLKDIPLSTLKVDRSFVKSLADNKGSRAITELIIGFARGLGLKSVAEGVESSEQAQALRDLGIDCMQGYLFAKPLSAPDFALLLKGH